MDQEALLDLLRQQVAKEIHGQTVILDLQAEKIRLLEVLLKQQRRITRAQSRKIKRITAPSWN